MDLGKFGIATVDSLKGKLAENVLGGAAKEMSQWLDDYKRAIAVLETFGFTVQNLSVSMISPEILTSIHGSIEDIREDELSTLMETYKDQGFIVLLLKALITAKQIWKHVELKLTGITLHATLGLIPKVTFEVH